MDLAARFAALWVRAGGTLASSAPTFAVIAHRYGEGHRAYHTLVHVEACLRDLDSLTAQVADPIALELALWFHDVVYDARRQDNEARSAELARGAMAAAGIPTPTIATVEFLILSTAHHAPDLTGDAAVMSDIDLAILGAAPVSFAAFEAGVAKEYGHLPRWFFRFFRRRFLRRLSRRPRLFHTESLYQRLETQARANLKG